MIKFGDRYCANCKHFPESYPVVSERCRRCEETSGPPTNYQPQKLTATTICHGITINLQTGEEQRHD